MREKKGSKDVNYTSRKLGFSISVPSGWKVSADRLGEEPSPSLEETYRGYKRFSEELGEDSIMGFEEFKRQLAEPPREEEEPSEQEDGEEELPQEPEKGPTEPIK